MKKIVNLILGVILAGHVLAQGSDDCSGATNLTVGATCTTTSFTNNENGQPEAGVTPNPSCLTGTKSSDVWFRVTGTGAMFQVTVSGTDRSGTIAVWSNCPGTTQVACMNVATGATGSMTFASVSATVYYIQIVRTSGGPNADMLGDICVTSFTPPANDNCSGATTLTHQANGSCTTVSSTVANATSSGIANCVGTADDDVWFRFTATGPTAIINRTTTGGWDSAIEVFASTGAAPGSCIGASMGCQDPEGSFTVTGLVTGMNYYVRVYTWGNGTIPGNPAFTICITSPVPPPANDNCSGATVLTQEPNGSCTVVSSTVAGATSSGIANCVGTADDDVWFRFTATGPTAIINRTATGGWDSAIEIFASTGAAPGSCIGASMGCLDPETAFTVNGLVTGMNYYVRVYTWGNGTIPGNPAFTICITSPVPPPPGSVIMTNGSASACSGNFYDPGSTGDYSSGTNNTMTICPSTAGAKLKMVFSSFSTESSFDFLEIFDGNSTSATLIGTYSGTTGPGTIQATAGNTSGCLTFRFTSDGSTVYPGWIAAISCVLPCQTITTTITSVTPAPGAGGIIRLCQGQSLTATGTGNFSSSGAGATYSWNFGNGVTAPGNSTTYTYPAVGSYYLNLVATDANGCTNTNYNNLVVQVSTTPSITTSATPATLCTNQASALNANVAMTTYSVNCTPPVSGTTFLPDGDGVSYETSITTNCYNPAATVTSPSDITNVCLTMEHSYLGDLQIELICPIGQTMILKSYDQDGSNTYLGSPIDDVTSGPGTGRTYCFTPSATVFLVDGTTSSAGSPASGSVVAGDYKPLDGFSNMIGCPLNGSWTIRVTDNLNLDDGYIFNWDINFSSGIIAVPSYTPTIVSQGWVAQSTLTSTGATTANVVPTNQGTPCFTYSVTDNFGCTYTAPQCITVNCGASLPIGLLSFEASAVDNSSVELNWETSSEQDNDYFVIERSADGFDGWEDILQVDGAGNSETPRDYSAIDEFPLDGVSYYRLKQVDFNGQQRIHETESVFIDNSGASELVIFPNPATDLLTIKGDLVSLSTFELLNPMGQNVRLNVQSYKQDDGSMVLDVSTLKAGVYLVKNGTKVYSFVKQ